jgi:hypothetical protein
MESQAASLRSAVESQGREVAALRGIAAAAEAESAAAKAELAQVGVFMSWLLLLMLAAHTAFPSAMTLSFPGWYCHAWCGRSIVDNHNPIKHLAAGEARHQAQEPGAAA